MCRARRCLHNQSCQHRFDNLHDCFSDCLQLPVRLLSHISIPTISISITYHLQVVVVIVGVIKTAKHSLCCSGVQPRNNHGMQLNKSSERKTAVSFNEFCVLGLLFLRWISFFCTARFNVAVAFIKVTSHHVIKPHFGWSHWHTDWLAWKAHCTLTVLLWIVSARVIQCNFTTCYNIFNSYNFYNRVRRTRPALILECVCWFSLEWSGLKPSSWPVSRLPHMSTMYSKNYYGGSCSISLTTTFSNINHDAEGLFNFLI